MPAPYANIQMCGVVPDDIKVDVRHDENGGGYVTIKVGGHTAAFTLSVFRDGDITIRDIARDLARKITDAVINLEAQ